MITAPAKLAQTIAKNLVQNKLCACVNIIPTVQSVYWWDDQVQTDEESLLIGKTVEENKESPRSRSGMNTMYPRWFSWILILAIQIT